MEQTILWTCLAFVAAVLALVVRQDWPHLTRTSEAVTGTVTGHRTQRSDDQRQYVAIIGFHDRRGHWVEIEDQQITSTPEPPVGTQVALRHPKGLPQLARVRRPWLRATLYALLLALAAILIGRITGWLGPGGF